MEALGSLFEGGAAEGAAGTAGTAAEAGSFAADTAGVAGGAVDYGALGSQIGTGEASFLPMAAEGGGFLSSLGQIGQYANTANNIMGLLKGIQGGGGSNAGTQNIPLDSSSTSPYTPTTAGSSGVSPEDYKKQQEAYFQQMFAGTGQGLPGGGLPQNIVDMIERQASLIK
jgi:hypothetical protein